MNGRAGVGVAIAVALVAGGAVYSGWNGRLRVTDIWMAQVDPSLPNHLELELSTCNAERRAEVGETDDAVYIRVKVRNDHVGSDCADGMTVTLEGPLGDRHVIDVSNWERLPVEG